MKSEIIQKIFNSGYKATIIECGHGAEIANTLLTELNASKFVLRCHQPYDKDVQNNEYLDGIAKFVTPPLKYARSVSAEFVRNVMFREEFFDGIEKLTKHLIIASSFQLDLDNQGLTHGYVGVMKRNRTEAGENWIADGKVYHISIYRHRHPLITKKEWIKKIKDEILNILSHTILETELTSTNIDGVWNVSSDLQSFIPDFDTTLKTTQFEKGENFICVDPNNNFIRLEDVIRRNKGTKKGLILQKGSFNPFHRMHNKIAQDAIQAYPDYPHVLMLSVNTCDKGKNDIGALTERIKNMTKLGYTVLVSKAGYFHLNALYLHEHYADLEIIFPIGEDTIERLLRDFEAWRGIDTAIVCESEKMEYYKEWFTNSEWFITRRTSDTKDFNAVIPKYATYLNNFKYSTLDMDDISSSKIRSGEATSEL